MALTPTTVYKGNPPTPGYSPVKDDIIALLNSIQTLAAGGAFTAVDVTLAGLPTTGSETGDIALVLSNEADGGVYRWQAGAWQVAGPLPIILGGETFALLAQAWAEGTLPGGAGTRSAREWAVLAEGWADTAETIAETLGSLSTLQDLVDQAEAARDDALSVAGAAPIYRGVVGNGAVNSLTFPGLYTNKASFFDVNIGGVAQSQDSFTIAQVSGNTVLTFGGIIPVGVIAEAKVSVRLVTPVSSAAGALEVGGVITVPTGSAALPTYSFTGDTNTGMFRNAADQIGFSTGGARRALLSNTALQVDVRIEGTAVTQSAMDTTAGRLMKVGDGGLLGTLPITSGSTDLRTRALTGGLWGYNTNSVPQHPDGGVSWAHAMLAMRSPNNLTGAGERNVYLTGRVTGTAQFLRLWWGADSSAPGEINWAEVITNRRLTDTVSQSGGVPTGGAMQGNANVASPTGGFTERLADGFQTVHHSLTTSTSADTVWTFNSAFLTGTTPVISIQPVGDSDLRVRLVARTATTCTFSIRDSGGARVAVPVDLIARGRWSNMT